MLFSTRNGQSTCNINLQAKLTSSQVVGTRRFLFRGGGSAVMPAFYSQSSMASQLPLTPPDSGSGYGYSSMHYPNEPYGPAAGMAQARHGAGFDYQQPYMQPAVAPAPPPYPYPQSSYQHPNSLPPIQNYYEPMGAPILPPLRIQERAYADDYHRRVQDEQQAAREQQRQAQKEEKPTGGVSAKLDYDMERMTDFVTQATESMYAYHNSPICLADIDLTRSFHQRMQSPPSFRKWVLQVLSATRLPSSTILLSLHYLNDRVANFPESVQSGENHIYRLLAVSLILGSKFLDDNTFINRSWSDVTAIKVAELNNLEMKWLDLIKYELHVDPKATNGVQSWMDAWRKWDADQVAKQQQAARLSPLDTGVHRHSTHRGRFSPYPSQYDGASSRSYETPQSARSHYSATPYSSTDPWAHSTQGDRYAHDYYRQNHYSAEDVHRRASDERARQSVYAYSHSAQPSYYQPTSYSANWDAISWGGAHAYDCGCSSCMYGHHYRPQYSMAPGYSAQPVMG